MRTPVETVILTAAITRKGDEVSTVTFPEFEALRYEARDLGQAHDRRTEVSADHYGTAFAPAWIQAVIDEHGHDLIIAAHAAYPMQVTHWTVTRYSDGSTTADWCDDAQAVAS